MWHVMKGCCTILNEMKGFDGPGRYLSWILSLLLLLFLLAGLRLPAVPGVSQVRYKKFWDLMNERDRPWHFDVVVHFCTKLSPYTCERYDSVTASTMQGILA